MMVLFLQSGVSRTWEPCNEKPANPSIEDDLDCQRLSRAEEQAGIAGKEHYRYMVLVPVLSQDMPLSCMVVDC